jgi:hypothetical protein
VRAALDALPDKQRRAIELAYFGGFSHSQIAELLDEPIGTVKGMPRSVEQVEPPAGLKASIMGVVEREATERSGAPARPSPRHSARERRLRRLFWPLRPVLAAVALALAVLAGFGIAQLTAGEDSRTVAAAVDESRIPGASARLQVQGARDGGAVLRVRGMPALDRGRVYQAWVERDGAILPQPTFEVGADGGRAVAIPDDVSDAQRVMVTREPRGGARTPGEKPILVATL